ncbi:MAG: TusE/DsrC/DsvC family sulfur relay protein [Gammaproteobacteria bacterium]
MHDLFNNEGFLRDPLLWNEDMAASIACQDGLSQLTREHWVIIRALREHYRKFGSAPPAFSHLCLANHMEKHCVAHLFRSQREAWRIAGLPDPGEEARAYM